MVALISVVAYPLFVLEAFNSLFFFLTRKIWFTPQGVMGWGAQSPAERESDIVWDIYLLHPLRSLRYSTLPTLSPCQAAFVWRYWFVVFWVKDWDTSVVRRRGYTVCFLFHWEEVYALTVQALMTRYR